MVAYILNTDAEVLEEGVLDKDEYMNMFSSFFVEGGRQAIVVYFQAMGPPIFGNYRHIYLFLRVCGNFTIDNDSKIKKKKK